MERCKARDGRHFDELFGIALNLRVIPIDFDDGYDKTSIRRRKLLYANLCYALRLT